MVTRTEQLRELEDRKRAERVNRLVARAGKVLTAKERRARKAAKRLRDAQRGGFR